MLLVQNICRTYSELVLNSTSKTQNLTVQSLRNISRICRELPSTSNKRPTSTSTVQPSALNTYFSVTRQKLGRSDAEIKKELTIPEPPVLEIRHGRNDIKMNKKKLWNAANLVARMPIEEAIVQSEFSGKLASQVVKEVLEEAKKWLWRNMVFKTNRYCMLSSPQLEQERI